MKITYKAGYPYQLRMPYQCTIALKPQRYIGTGYIRLYTDGGLCLSNGYAWDGPSGPVAHDKTIMRGSLIHDALYQLLRDRHLPPEAREAADRALQQACIEDGMPRWKAWLVYQAVRLFGEPAADPASERPLLTAP